MAESSRAAHVRSGGHGLSHRAGLRPLGQLFQSGAFGCNTTLPWGMYSQATHDYLTSSVVTVPKGVTIDPNLPVHPTFLYESIWCFVGLFLLVRYIKKRRFAGDIALRYLVWYGAGRFWIEALRTDSLLLVPSLGLRASQLVAAAAVVGGVALEIFLTRKYKSKASHGDAGPDGREPQPAGKGAQGRAGIYSGEGRTGGFQPPQAPSWSARMPITGAVKQQPSKEKRGPEKKDRP